MNFNCANDAIEAQSRKYYVIHCRPTQFESMESKEKKKHLGADCEWFSVQGHQDHLSQSHARKVRLVNRRPRLWRHHLCCECETDKTVVCRCGYATLHSFQSSITRMDIFLHFAPKCIPVNSFINFNFIIKTFQFLFLGGLTRTTHYAHIISSRCALVTKKFPTTTVMMTMSHFIILGSALKTQRNSSDGKLNEKRHTGGKSHLSFVRVKIVVMNAKAHL